MNPKKMISIDNQYIQYMKVGYAWRMRLVLLEVRTGSFPAHDGCGRLPAYCYFLAEQDVRLFVLWTSIRSMVAC